MVSNEKTGSEQGGGRIGGLVGEDTAKMKILV